MVLTEAEDGQLIKDLLALEDSEMSKKKDTSKQGFLGKLFSRETPEEKEERRRIKEEQDEEDRRIKEEKKEVNRRIKEEKKFSKRVRKNYQNYGVPKTSGRCKFKNGQFYPVDIHNLPQDMPLDAGEVFVEEGGTKLLHASQVRNDYKGESIFNFVQVDISEISRNQRMLDDRPLTAGFPPVILT